MGYQEYEERVYRSDETGLPMFRFDADRCRGCGECVEVSQTIAFCEGLTLRETAAGRKMVPAAGRWPDGCTGCGVCVDACTTGALYEAPASMNSVNDESQKVIGHCPQCAAGCAVTIHIHGTIRPMDKKSSLCARGRYAGELSVRTEEPALPRVRRKGHLESWDWDRAIDDASEKIVSLLQRFGPDRIAMVVSPHLPLEDLAAAGEFARHVFQSQSIYFVPGISRGDYRGIFTGIEELDAIDDQSAKSIVLVNLSEQVISAVPRLQNALERLLGKGATLFSLQQSMAGHTDWEILSDFVQSTGSLAERISSAQAAYVVLPGRRFVEHESAMGHLIRRIHTRSNGRIRFVLDSEQVNVLETMGWLQGQLPGLHVADGQALSRAIQARAYKGFYLLDVDPIRQLAGGMGLLEGLRQVEWVALHERFTRRYFRLPDVTFPVCGWYGREGHFYDGSGILKKMPGVIPDPRKSNRELLRDLANRMGKTLLQLQFQIDSRDRRYANIPDGSSPLTVAGGTSSPGFGKLRLTLRSSRFYIEGGDTSLHSRLRSFQDFDAIVINPDDGSRFDVSDGDTVLVRSAWGTVKGRAVWDHRVRLGWVQISNYLPGTYAHLLWPAGGNLSDPVDVMIMRSQRPFEPAEDQLRCLRFHR